MSEIFVCNQVYPSLKALSPDPQAARIIASAYASSTGELNVSLQHMWHSINFLSAKMPEISQLLSDISRTDYFHLSLLGEALSRLGASPVFSAAPPARYAFYSAKFVSYSDDPRTMLEDDIIAKKRAIACYGKMTRRLTDPVLKSLAARITTDERLHLSALERALSDV